MKRQTDECQNWALAHPRLTKLIIGTIVAIIMGTAFATKSVGLLVGWTLILLFAYAVLWAVSTIIYAALFEVRR